MKRDRFAIGSAMLCLLSGIVLSYLSYFFSIDGTIDNSVLWYVAQMLLYAGSVFGLKGYIDYRTRR